MRIIRIPGLYLSFATFVQPQKKSSRFNLGLYRLLRLLGFGLYDTAVGIVDIVWKVTVIDALSNALPGGSLIILVQSVCSTEKGKPCILCAALDTIFAQQFVPQRDSIMFGFIVGEPRIEHVHELLDVKLSCTRISFLKI